MPVENPYSFEPAVGDHFVGRTDILEQFRKRLTASDSVWQASRAWMVIGPGGIGKTSLLHRLLKLAKDEFRAETVSVDLGWYADLDDPMGLITAFEAQLPSPPHMSMRVRQLFGLPPDAPASAIVSQLATMLLRSGLQLSVSRSLDLGLAGTIAPPAQDNRSMGLADRFASLINALVVLSEDKPRPVIVCCDQLGHLEDRPRTRAIVLLLLNLAAHVRKHRMSNLVLLFGVRPEHLGMLQYHLSRTLFDVNVLEHIDMRPLDHSEALNAVLIRSGDAYMPYILAARIVGAVASSDGTVEPYTLQLSAMAVWQHLYGSAVLRSPNELTDAEVGNLIRAGVTLLMDPLRAEPVVWEILILLTNYSTGLTEREIIARLPADLHATPDDVTEAINTLATPKGYRLLTVVSNSDSPRSYMIAHDLLRDSLAQQVPTEMQRRAQARRLLDDSVWRYHTQSTILSLTEMNIIYEERAHLVFDQSAWKLLMASEIHSTETHLTGWAALDDTAVATALIALEIDHAVPQAYLRLQLARTAITKIGWHLIPLLDELARTELDVDTRLRAVEALGKLGTPALPVLNELARTSSNDYIRIGAAKFAGKLGQVQLTLPILDNLARTGQSLSIRMQALYALGELGTPALPVLIELAHTDDEAVRSLLERGHLQLALSTLDKRSRTNSNDNIREWVARTLIGRGEPQLALPILDKLAHSDFGDYTRMEAVKALIERGEPQLALPILDKLARTSRHEDIRRLTARILIELGQPQLALPILDKLARTSPYSDTPRRAIEALEKLGTPALPVLSELARTSSKVDTRLEAARTLIKLGQAQLVLPILDELARTSSDDYTRIHAAEALIELGQAQLALPVLEEIARTSSRDYARTMAAEALIELGQAQLALLVLEEIVRASSDDYAPMRAVGVLEKLGTPALSVLSELARTNSNYDISIQAVGALEKLGTPALSVLSELARTNSNYYIRMNAARTLVRLGQVQLVLPILDKLVPASSNADICKEAFEALEKLDTLALPILDEFARTSSHDYIRLEAARTLIKLGQAQQLVLPILVELAGTSSMADIRLEAARTLIKLGQAQLTLPVLNKLARTNSDDHTRSRALETLEELGSVALPVLSKLARTSNANTRIGAARILVRLGQEQLALSVLGKLAQTSSEQDIRLQALETLIELGAVALLMLDELARTRSDADVRMRALEALVELEQAHQLAPLVLNELMRTSSHDHIRLMAAVALIELGQVEFTLPVLDELAQTSSDANICMQAAKVLEELVLSPLALASMAWSAPMDKVGIIAVLRMAAVITRQPKAPAVFDYSAFTGSS